MKLRKARNKINTLNIHEQSVFSKFVCCPRKTDIHPVLHSFVSYSSDQMLVLQKKKKEKSSYRINHDCLLYLPKKYQQ